MAEHNGNGRSPGADPSPRLLNLVAVVIRRWRTVAGTTIAVLLGTALVLVLKPDTYTAQTLLVPSTSRNSTASPLMGAQNPFAFMISSNSGQELIGVIARSRRLADAMVKHLGATDEQDEEMEASIRTALARDMELITNPDGSIVVRVSAEDPRLAARVANALPELINNITARLTAQSARRRYQFLEEQLAQARARLEQSDQRLVAFQKGANAPELEEQGRRAIDAAAELQRGIVEQELQVTQLRRSLTPDHPELRAAVSQLEARREQLRRLTTGGRTGGQLFPSLRESPELKSAATRILREYNRDEQVYLSLTAALADAQIEADRSLPIITVLDPALVPRFPSGASAVIVLGIAALFGILFGLVAAFVSEYSQRARHDPGNEPFFTALDQFRMDVSRLAPYRGKHGGERPSRMSAEVPSSRSKD